MENKSTISIMPGISSSSSLDDSLTATSSCWSLVRGLYCAFSSKPYISKGERLNWKNSWIKCSVLEPRYCRTASLNGLLHMWCWVINRRIISKTYDSLFSGLASRQFSSLFSHGTNLWVIAWLCWKNSGVVSLYLPVISDRGLTHRSRSYICLRKFVVPERRLRLGLDWVVGKIPSTENCLNLINLSSAKAPLLSWVNVVLIRADS